MASVDAPSIRKVLDLSSAHLPEELGSTGSWVNIASIAGLVVYPLSEYGWMLWVPSNDEEIAEHISNYDIPAEVESLWRYARGHGCDYIIFDADGPVNEELAHWDW